MLKEPSTIDEFRVALAAEAAAVDALRAECDAAAGRAEAAEAEADGRADERAQVVAFCNAVGHHGARDAIAAGLHWSRD